VRLATFNVLHGRSLADGVVSSDRLVAACGSLEADVLCLQEIDRGQVRSGGIDQTAAVAAGTGAAAWRFEPAIVGEPGGRWRAATGGDAGGGEPGYGVGIVSRRPVRAWHTVRLGAAPVRSPVAVPGGRGRFLLLPDEPRVALVADLGGLVVATTHLSFVPGWNLVQVRRLVRALRGLAGPGVGCVLLGDLNAPGPLPAWASGWRRLARVPTYPAERPSMQLDHALGRGPLPPVERAEARLLPLSDHRAVVVELASPRWP
jgi:endonuclease/exonuclease/phosphatase family metal-dependent hydrolase